MRLIDADALIAEMKNRTSGIADANWNCKVLELIINQDAPTVNAIEIPKGATNGDMIVDMFPDLEFEIDELYKRILVINISNYYAPTFPLDWWNAPYKREVEE